MESCERTDRNLYDCLTAKSAPMWTRENEDVDRQLKILMKGVNFATFLTPLLALT